MNSKVGWKRNVWTGAYHGTNGTVIRAVSRRGGGYWLTTKDGALKHFDKLVRAKAAAL